MAIIIVPPSPHQEKLPENRELFLLQEVRNGRWRDENPKGGFENVPGDISTTSCARSPAEQGERSESIPPSPPGSQVIII